MLEISPAVLAVAQEISEEVDLLDDLHLYK
jgi:hypothetical protein